MNEKLETQGKTVDDAVNEALLRLGARRDEVDVTVLEEPRGGFLGLIGGHPAKVEVTRKRSRRRGARRDPGKTEAHEFGEETGSGRSPRGGRGSREGSRRNNSGRNEQPPRNAAAPQDDGASPEGQKRSNNQQKGQGRGDQSNSRNKNRNSRRPRNQRPGHQQGGSRQDTRSAQNQEQPAVDQRDNANSEQKRSRNQRRSRPARQETAQQQPQQTKEKQQVNESRPARPERQPRQDRQPREERRPRQDRNAKPSRPETPEGPTRHDEFEQPRAQEGRGNKFPPERQASRAARVANNPPDEIIATGISAGKYANPTRDIDPENLNNTLEEMTTGLLARAGFPARCEVKDGEYRQIRVITGDDSAGMLIGRHGATIDSVEHLVERMASNAVGDRVRMNLDINNYRLRRHESLLERVEDAVGQIRESGKTYHVEPMNARERRIVHLAVEEYEDMRTFTMDSHRGRHVVIAFDHGDKDEAAADEAATDEAAAQGSSYAAEPVVDSEVTIDSNEAAAGNEFEGPDMDERPEA